MRQLEAFYRVFDRDFYICAGHTNQVDDRVPTNAVIERNTERDRKEAYYWLIISVHIYIEVYKETENRKRGR